MMNIFKLDKDIRSYKYPIIKIVICIVIIFLMLIDVIFDQIHISLLDIKIIDILFRASGTIVIIACVLRIYISFAELILVSENRAKDKALSDRDIISSEEYTIGEIIAMVESNDILAIEIVSDKKKIEIGSSSYSESFSSKLTDKLYYIDKEEFYDIEQFKSKLFSYLVNEKVLVISVDGIPAKKIKKKHIGDDCGS